MKSQSSLKKILQLAVCSTLLSGASLSGEEEDRSVVTLEPYVVVATRTPLGLDRISPSVSYIGEGSMEFWQQKSLLDALSAEPGVTFSPNGTQGNLTGMSIRGAKSDQSAMFLDGRLLSPGYSNQFNVSALTLGGLQSVQLQKGPSTLNYGSSGIGGVVALETKRSRDLDEGMSGAVEAEVGSNEYLRGQVDFAYKADRLSLSFSSSRMDTENERFNDSFEENSALLRLDYEIVKNVYFELLGQAIETDNNSAGATYPTTFDVEGADQISTSLFSPGLRVETDTLSAHFFYSKTRTDVDSQTYDFFGSTFDSNVETDEVNLQVDYTLYDENLLSVGAVYRDEQAESSFSSMTSVEQTGLWAQYIMRDLSNLEVRLGARYDTYSDFQDALTGQVEVIYNLNEYTTLFAKVATAYAPPTASDIAYDTVTNPELKPEESLSYELGFSQSYQDGDLIWSALYFRNEIDQLIENPTFFDAINIDEALTEGVELTFAWRLTEKAKLDANYTYTTAMDKSSGTRLARVPRHSVYLGLSYDWTEQFRTGFGVQGLFDREDLDGSGNVYTQVDHEDQIVARIVADWAINDAWTLFARVENLFDEAYAPVLGYPGLGRAYYTGLRFEF